MSRVAVFTIAFLVIFTVFTTVFAASANKAEVRLLPKWAWVLLCIAVPFFGGLLYLMVGRPLGRGPRPQKRKTVAPDDDPSFLRDLDEKLRKEEDDKKDESN
jgi:membrane protein implicated in regulation of membrane protease activity